MAYSIFSEGGEAKHKAHDTGKDYGESGKEVECVRLVSIWTVAQVHPLPHPRAPLTTWTGVI